jgi:uncharacterized protein (TIGR02145 family)
MLYRGVKRLTRAGEGNNDADSDSDSCGLAIAVSMTLGSAIAVSKRMPDGREWTTENLNVVIADSYCYGDTASNCDQYGRLYTWAAAQRGCQSLGAGWRLPTEDEWHQLGKHFGGIREESADLGKAAFTALTIGGGSGFNALLGGNRGDDGQYARLDAHGVYWTASETDPDKAWLYNFGRGGQSLNRHREGNKQMAVSVRCIRE